MKQHKQIIINSEQLETRVALLKDKRLEEYQVERKNATGIVGSVYVGRVVNIEMNLRAVFVDIGLEKNAFMHFSDMMPATSDLNLDNDRKIRVEDIPKLFPVGSKALVQVTKGPIGTKGPRVTADIAIPGRYLVFMPLSEHVGVSRKIEDGKERERLKKIMEKMSLPKGTGCICRTVGEGRKSLFFKRDLNMLLERWKAVEKIRQSGKAPCLVYAEPNLLERTMRDFLTEDIDEIVIDNKSDFVNIKEFVAKVVSRGVSEMIKLYDRPDPIFEYYQVENQISDIFKRVVKLPSGGYICVDETEAMVAIDVNTGNSRAGADKAETFLLTNLEAADEVARQLRLRNVGGLVVIDFIDMTSMRDREHVTRRMRKALSDDRAKTKTLPISALGLMEMTRQRENESLLDTVYNPCPYCEGRGKVKSPLTMSVEIQRDLKEIMKRKKFNRSLAVRVITHPTILARLKNEDARFLANLEEEYGKDLSFRADPSIHVEDYRLIDPNTGEELLS